MTANAPTSVDDARRYAPATLRNRAAITAVLADHLPATGHVLEVASGSGEHAAHFAAAFPALVFHPTDPDPSARASIAAWTAVAGLGNLRPPDALDASIGPWPDGPFDAVLCVNMIHIAPWAACVGLLAGTARVLAPTGFLYLYGPFQRDGRHTAPSNAEFDASLRARDPAWGVRDLGDVAEEALKSGLTVTDLVEMPANNLSVVLRPAADRDRHRASAPQSPGHVARRAPGP
jgi:SAM-dependent methyltransferase